jgi:hypothetical protein
VDLVQRVASDLNVDNDRAIHGLGVVFLAVRMASDAKTFGDIAAAFPDVGAWMQKAPLSARWTGEMLAMATPRALKRILLNAGFKEEQVDALCAGVGSAIREEAGAEAYELVAKKLPLLADE